MREPRTPLEEQIEAAFHYRGHTTIHLAGGQTVEGYLYNREFEGSESLRGPGYVEVFLKGSGEPKRLEIHELERVELTGQDHAEA